MGLDPWYHFLPKPGWQGRRGRRGSGGPAPQRPTPPRGYLPGPAGAPPSADTAPHKHSPILPLGFVDVTVSASANFAALVFKQVLDPLPLAAQLHFKVIVHCHGLRGRGAGAGGPGDTGGDRGSTGSRSPREPSRSTPGGRGTGPTDAARAGGGPARAPGTSRGAAGQWPAGGGVGPGGSPGRRRASGGRGLGVGRGFLALVPAGSRRRCPGSPRPRVLLPLRGAAERPLRVLLLPNAHSRLTRSHTHARTHSFTHSPIHSNRKAAPHNSRCLLRERRREGTLGTRPRLSQKRREGSGSLRPSLHPAPPRRSAPARAGTGGPSAGNKVATDHSCSQTHHVDVPTAARALETTKPRMHGPLLLPPLLRLHPTPWGYAERCMMGLVVQGEISFNHLGEKKSYSDIVSVCFES